MIANFLYRNSKTANIKRRYQSGISDFCGTQSGVRATSRLPRRNGSYGRSGGPGALQTSSIGEDSSEAKNSDSCGARSGVRATGRLPRQVCRSRELEGRAPSRPPRPREGRSRLIQIRTRPYRALLVGLRPPTPQSPEELRSTPFDCVAIAPCCFAERKAVLSHALAALTALGPVRKPG